MTVKPFDPQPQFKPAGMLSIGDTIITKDDDGKRHQMTVKALSPCPTERANIHVNGKACHARFSEVQIRRVA